MGQHTAPDHLRIGILETIPHDGGPTVTVDLVNCVHCGYVWQYIAGSGRVRGWCMKCNGLLCGRRYCREQVPCRCWQWGIERAEAGGSINDQAPIAVNVTGTPPSG